HGERAKAPAQRETAFPYLFTFWLPRLKSRANSYSFLPCSAISRRLQSSDYKKKNTTPNGQREQRRIVLIHAIRAIRGCALAKRERHAAPPQQSRAIRMP